VVGHRSGRLYEVLRRAKGYFSINAAGHVQVHPTKDASRAIDAKQLALTGFGRYGPKIEAMVRVSSERA